MPNKKEQLEENKVFKQIKKKIQGIINDYLEERAHVSSNIIARSYGVTIIGFSNIDEKKYLQATKLLTSLKADVYRYKDLYELLTAAEADNAKLVKRTLYSKGELGKALKACLDLIPEEKKNDIQPMRRVVTPTPISTLFSAIPSDTSLDNNSSIGPSTNSESSPLTVKK